MRAGDVVSLRVSSPEGPTEVVGTLVAASAEALSVRRRDGSIVRVAVDDVRAGRVVPPGPARTISVPDLERVAAAGWRALETEPLGEWLLRASGGFTSRANSALAVGDPGLPLDAAVAGVERWYADRSLPARIQLVQPAGEGTEDLLRRRGWRSDVIVEVMTAEIAHVLRAVDVKGPPPVRVDAEPDGAWLETYRSESGPLPPVATAVLTNHPNAAFMSVRSDAGCEAIARVAVDGRWAGLFAVEVAEGARRRGLGRVVSAAALRWAAAAGARHAYLQVAHGNDPARALYERLGFDRHHRYEHWLDR